ncbi:hypothetical protein NDU88_006872 [Pleurodeles waltl]|uniref:Uncharacterized protein n=1 Tax=Pleurodeles waltl TaxID=8319 RepID=A0AAV7SR72_PLEWA|nr:hypothetical protein NDU88_006872 [Pleurodeles waltl]
MYRPTPIQVSPGQSPAARPNDSSRGPRSDPTAERPHGTKKYPPRRRPPILQAVTLQEVALRPATPEAIRAATRLPGRAGTGSRSTDVILGGQKQPSAGWVAVQYHRRTGPPAHFEERDPGSTPPQVSPGTAQGSPVSSAAARNAPRHEAADPTACVQSPLQLSLRRCSEGTTPTPSTPPLPRYPASSVLTG